MLILFLTLGMSDNFDKALDHARSLYPSAVISPDLTASLNSVGCSGIAQVNLGEMTVTQRHHRPSSSDRTLTAPLGTLTFVKCDNGDKFALNIPGKAEMQNKAGGRLVAGSQMSLGDAMIGGRPSAYEVRQRPDGRTFYRLGWKTRSGRQAIAMLYDARDPVDGKARLHRIVGRLIPVIQ